MILQELLTELKEYLRIDSMDTEDDEYLTSFVEAAAGYIASVYRYHILDETLVEKQMFPYAHPLKFYLSRGPVKDGTVNITAPDGAPIEVGLSLLNNTVILSEQLEPQSGLYTITYDVGISDGIEYAGDVEHCVSLAAWLYRTADKGLEGIDQISTGVKESAKMFKGIPNNITAYFQTRQVIRL